MSHIFLRTNPVNFFFSCRVQDLSFQGRLIVFDSDIEGSYLKGATGPALLVSTYPLSFFTSWKSSVLRFVQGKKYVTILICFTSASNIKQNLCFHCSSIENRTTFQQNTNLLKLDKTYINFSLNYWFIRTGKKCKLIVRYVTLRNSHRIVENANFVINEYSRKYEWTRKELLRKLEQICQNSRKRELIRQNMRKREWFKESRKCCIKLKSLELIVRRNHEFLVDFGFM